MDINGISDLNCVVLSCVISCSYDLYHISGNVIHTQESCNKIPFLVQPNEKLLLGYFSNKIVMLGIKALLGMQGPCESSNKYGMFFGLYLLFLISSRDFSSLKLISYKADFKTASQIPSDSS